MKKVKRTTKWYKKLTIAELRHIHKTTTRVNLSAFKRNLAAQRELGIVCHECNLIAGKLDIDRNTVTIG